MERSTRQRDAIRLAIESAKRPLSADEVLDLTRKSIPSMGKATVYRNLKLLLQGKHVEPVMLPGENPRYEMAALDHHHHFQCTACDRVFDVPECPGSLSHMAPRGFSVEHHDVILYGHCGDCRRQPNRRSRPPV